MSSLLSSKIDWLWPIIAPWITLKRAFLPCRAVATTPFEARAFRFLITSSQVYSLPYSQPLHLTRKSPQPLQLNRSFYATPHTLINPLHPIPTRFKPPTLSISQFLSTSPHTPKLTQRSPNTLPTIVVNFQFSLEIYVYSLISYTFVYLLHFKRMQYRNSLNFSPETFKSAVQSLKRIDKLHAKLVSTVNAGSSGICHAVYSYYYKDCWL